MTVSGDQVYYRRNLANVAGSCSFLRPACRHAPDCTASLRISLMHEIAVIAFDGVVPFELAMPCEVFGRAVVPGQEDPYVVRVCGETAAIKAGAFDLRVPFGLAPVATADTVIVPGIADPAAPVSDALIMALRGAADQGARIASICTGAFVLAAAGLLDGRRATTHWRAASALAARYPMIEVDPGLLYVDEGLVLTSAGAAAGLDLCLHMLRRDHGAAVAADAARVAVMPLERDGGQAQFIVHAPPSSGTTLEPLLRWMLQNLHRSPDLEEIAVHAGMSTRSLSRRFREQVGTTPMQWMLTARVRRAQALLETTRLSVEQVALQVGFESAVTLRERFSRELSISPKGYRRAMGGMSASCARPARDGGHDTRSQHSRVSLAAGGTARHRG